MLHYYLFLGKKVFSFIKIALLLIVVYVGVVALLMNFSGSRQTDQTNLPQESPDRIKLYSYFNNPDLVKNKNDKKILGFFKQTYCFLAGEFCTDNLKANEQYVKKSLLGRLSGLIVVPYAHPPASGIYWAYSSLQNAGFVPKTYAAGFQGFGFAGLLPLSNIWKMSRDFAYVLLVLVMITIGFMIMFRAKLNPQTVITVENALPKIVVALILITFSFAIAGFLIDLMYVVIAISISILSGHGNFYTISDFQDKFINARFAELFPSSLNGLGGLLDLSQALINFIPFQMNQILRLITGIFTAKFVTSWTSDTLTPITDKIGSLLSSVIGLGVFSEFFALILNILIAAVGGTIGFGIGYTVIFPLIILFLISFTAIYLVFRIFFMLLATYIKILLMIVFSPIIMLFEAVPGKSAFGWWIKNLLAEIMVFPLVIILFIVGHILSSTTASAGTLWKAPFLSDINPNAFSVVLGMGVVYMIPDLVKLVKEMAGAKGLPVGLSLGTFFGGAAAGVGGGLGLVGQYGSLSLALPGLKRFGKHLPFGEFKDDKGNPGNLVTGAQPPAAHPQKGVSSQDGH